MKKNDYLLIAAVLLAVTVVSGIHFLRRDDGNGLAEIYVDGKRYGTYPLQTDCTVDINGKNILVIQDGRADMIEADCPDKLCVHQMAISRDGESIICLPNKVVVSVRSNKAGSLDAVTH